MTNEEKLNDIYTIVMAQENRRKAGIYFSFFKWVIIASILYFIMSHPDAFIGKIMETMKPIILDQVHTMMEEQQ